MVHHDLFLKLLECCAVGIDQDLEEIYSEEWNVNIVKPPPNERHPNWSKNEMNMKPVSVDALNSDGTLKLLDLMEENPCQHGIGCNSKAIDREASVEFEGAS